MPGEERRDEGKQRREIGGEVDVHVGEHARVARRPDSWSASPRPFPSRRTARDAGELVLEGGRRAPTVPSVLPLSAIVMRAAQGKARSPRYACRRSTLGRSACDLVVDGNDQVDGGRLRREGGAGAAHRLSRGGTCGKRTRSVAVTALAVSGGALGPTPGNHVRRCEPRSRLASRREAEREPDHPRRRGLRAREGVLRGARWIAGARHRGDGVLPGERRRR